MPRRRKKSARQPSSKNSGKIQIRTGRAQDHGELANELVHIFVDDQNLFWRIVNDRYGPQFRIDFGRLLIESAKVSDGTHMARGVSGSLEPVTHEFRIISPSAIERIAY